MSRHRRGAAPVRTRCAALLVGLSLLAGVAHSATSTSYGAFLDQVEVDLVNVDVVVTDRSGRPVLDLELGDFEVSVDGEVVTITHFAKPLRSAAAAAPTPSVAASPETPETSPADSPPASEPTTVVVYVDQTAIAFSQRARVLRDTERFLVERLPADARVLVATHETGLRILTDLTTDRQAIAGAFAAIGKTVSPGQAARAEEQQILRELDIAQNEFEGSDQGFGPGQRLPTEEAEILRDLIEATAAREIGLQRAALGSLASLLSALAGHEGRKVMVLAGGGLATRPGGRLVDLWTARFGGLNVRPPRIGGGGDQDTLALLAVHKQLLEAAKATRVTIVAIDAAEDGAGSFEAASVGSAETKTARATLVGDEESRANLVTLAETTGGRSLRSGPDLLARLEVVADELETAYSLGFAAGGDVDDGYHRLAVRIRRDGLRARHREGYRKRTASQRAADAALATAAFAGAADNPLAVAVDIGTATPGKGGDKTVAARVKVPLRHLTLLPDGDRQLGRIALHLAIRDPRGQISQLTPRQLPVTIPNTQLAAALEQLLGFDIAIPLPPGEHRLAVVVHDEIGDARSTVLTPLVVLP